MASPLAQFEYLLRLLSPFVARAFLQAIAELRMGMLAGELERLIAAGNVQGVIDLAFASGAFDRSMREVKTATRLTVIRSGRRFQREIPIRRIPGRRPPGAPPGSGLLRVQFNVLDRRLVSAVQQFEERLIAETGKTLQAGLREAIEDGIRRGVNPRTVARGIRDIVGLAPNQVRYLANLREELSTGQFAKVFERELRDRRFDQVLHRLMRDGGSLTAEQVDRMAEAYRKRLIANHAETAARTVTINSLKIGKKAVWEQAVDQGVVRRDDMEREWVSRLDDRVRDTHREMHGKRIGMDEQWDVPGVGLVDYPGELEFNCRCVEVFRVKIRRDRATL